MNRVQDNTRRTGAARSWAAFPVVEESVEESPVGTTADEIAAQITDRTPRGIAATVSRLISAGTLSVGDRLPTVRVLARELGVSPTTVSDAWQSLAAVGSIRTQGRAGSFVLGPPPLVRMGAVALVVGLLIVVFYKELLVSSFDPGLAFSLGINATVVHYSLMSVLSVVVVSAFESVGAILVIAMLILPGATASLLSPRLPRVLLLTLLHAALSSVLGVMLALWLECSIAGAMVVMGGVLFGLVWVFSPTQGLLRRWLHRSVEAPGEVV